MILAQIFGTDIVAMIVVFGSIILMLFKWVNRLKPPRV